eukprot:900657-Pelagomonas_calceolata.AAC.2
MHTFYHYKPCGEARILRSKASGLLVFRWLLANLDTKGPKLIPTPTFLLHKPSTVPLFRVDTIPPPLNRTLSSCDITGITLNTWNKHRKQYKGSFAMTLDAKGAAKNEQGRNRGNQSTDHSCLHIGPGATFPPSPSLLTRYKS